MSLVNTLACKGMSTRSLGDAERLPEDAESGDTTEPMSADAFLRAAIEELREMREERAQRQR